MIKVSTIPQRPTTLPPNQPPSAHSPAPPQRTVATSTTYHHHLSISWNWSSSSPNPFPPDLEKIVYSIVYSLVGMGCPLEVGALIPLTQWALIPVITPPCDFPFTAPMSNPWREKKTGPLLVWLDTFYCDRLLQQWQVLWMNIYHHNTIGQCCCRQMWIILGEKSGLGCGVKLQVRYWKLLLQCCFFIGFVQLSILYYCYWEVFSELSHPLGSLTCTNNSTTRELLKQQQKVSPMKHCDEVVKAH